MRRLNEGLSHHILNSGQGRDGESRADDGGKTLHCKSAQSTRTIAETRPQINISTTSPIDLSSPPRPRRWISPEQKPESMFKRLGLRNVQSATTICRRWHRARYATWDSSQTNISSRQPPTHPDVIVKNAQVQKYAQWFELAGSLHKLVHVRVASWGLEWGGHLGEGSLSPSPP
jgi:hypothetical protein